MSSNAYEWARTQIEFPFPDDTEGFQVSDWLTYFLMNDRDTWNLRVDFPNIAPPFRNYFMFGHHGPEMLFEGKLQKLSSSGELGAFFHAKKEEDGNFSLIATTCAGTGGRYMWHPLAFKWRVSPTGAFLSWDAAAEARGENVLVAYQGEAVLSAEKKKEIELSNGLLVPFLIATSVLHCKNVSARKVQPSRQVRRAAERAGKPIYTYSVLDVGPMMKTLGSEGGMAATGIKQALHICRGHFKDYRDGRGLFGRYQGLFWWDQTLRGEGPAIHDKLYRMPLDKGVAGA